MRATPQVDCSDNDSVDNIRGIVYYNFSASIPNTTGYDYVDGCEDEDVSNLVPVLNSTTMVANWSDPTLLQVQNNDTSFSTSEATTVPVPHPIHLYGFDFYVLAQDTGPYSSDTTLNLANPPRRDFALLPSQGYLVLAFQTDNPGAWLNALSYRFLVRESEIGALIDPHSLQSTCDNWDSYVASNNVVLDDSVV
ncbi:hypothetical protein BR93DRAFT_995576 [Coniochaeta sp. PMI_546]|nr:hypothetical protein BR93DRAFT_995576 [Coniochaeta sp. PMI_546]